MIEFSNNVRNRTLEKPLMRMWRLQSSLRFHLIMNGDGISEAAGSGAAFEFA